MMQVMLFLVELDSLVQIREVRALRIALSVSLDTYAIPLYSHVLLEKYVLQAILLI